MLYTPENVPRLNLQVSTRVWTSSSRAIKSIPTRVRNGIPICANSLLADTYSLSILSMLMRISLAFQTFRNNLNRTFVEYLDRSYAYRVCFEHACNPLTLCLGILFSERKCSETNMRKSPKSINYYSNVYNWLRNVEDPLSGRHITIENDLSTVAR